MLSKGLIEMDLDDPEYEEAYDDDLEESASAITRDRRGRPLFARAPPPYYRPRPTQQVQQGTITTPGNPPIPLRISNNNNYVTTNQLQTSLKRVQQDVIELAAAISNLKNSQGGGMNAILPMLLLGQSSTPEIDKIIFSDTNSAPFNTTEELTLSKTTYKSQKSNLGLILALSMMGDNSKDSSSNMLVMALALSGGL